MGKPIYVCRHACMQIVIIAIQCLEVIKSILYSRRLVVYRNPMRYWCKMVGDHHYVLKGIWYIAKMEGIVYISYIYSMYYMASLLPML